MPLSWPFEGKLLGSWKYAQMVTKDAHVPVMLPWNTPEMTMHTLPCSGPVNGFVAAQGPRPCHCFPDPGVFKCHHFLPTTPAPLPAIHFLCSPKIFLQSRSDDSPRPASHSLIFVWTAHTFRGCGEASFYWAHPHPSCMGPGQVHSPSVSSSALSGQVISGSLGWV